MRAEERNRRAAVVVPGDDPTRGGGRYLRPAANAADFGGGPRWMPPVATAYPRPTNGIFVAMTVMNNTLASNGSPAI